MSTHKHIDRICCGVLAVTVLLTLLFMNGSSLGIQSLGKEMGYESRLFDASRVHTIDIVMDDWEGFLSECSSEEYAVCSVVIDGEAYKNVAIRAKGNTSLTQVQSYGNDRYSFKIEFDHYDSSKTYYGLDKLCLNNIIQDNTYMKDYLTYQLMADFGVASPLCSYVNISVNGETWGLYLAVEGVEESFLQRNYGSDYGELYKPDSTSMGGGRGNGKDFQMDDWEIPGSDDAGTDGSAVMPTMPSNDASAPNEAAESTEPASGPSESPAPPSAQDTAQPNEASGGSMTPPGMDGAGGMGMPGGSGMTPPDMGGMSIPEGTAPAADSMPAADDTLDSTAPSMDAQDGGFSAFDPGSFAGQAPEDMTLPAGMERPEGMELPEGMDISGGMSAMNSFGSSDVSLIYSDDSYDSYANIFDNAKTAVTDADKDRLISALKNINTVTDLESSVAVEDVIRYFVIHNFVLNFDSYTGSMIHNYYLYEEDAVLSMIPWDYNLAFGGFQSASDAATLVNYPIDSPVSGGTVDSRPMLAWIFSSAEYTALYHSYFAQFLTDYYDSGRLAEMIDSVKEMICPYVESDPTKFCTYEEFETGIDTLKEFCLLRCESIRGQLEGTIGSTTETQQDRSGFIDAGDLSISDMGSMNQSMGSFGDTDAAFGGSPGGQNGEAALPDEMASGSVQGGMTPPLGQTGQENTAFPDASAMPQQMGGDAIRAGQFSQAERPASIPESGGMAQTASGAGITIAVTALVLAAGLAFALCFRRRKQ